MKFTLEFENKLQAVRVLMAIEEAADGADAESHKFYLALTMKVRAQLDMDPPADCGCEDCSGPWVEK